MSFHKILIANRGEIACRVLRTARTLGYRTVAVYSQADAHAPHVAQADEAVCIGPAPASASYLDIARVLAAARASGANAIHPGYGFLSERADFAQACAEAGIHFIGPPAAAITAMGDKAAAKRRMIAAGVPTVPGHLGEPQDDAALIAAAADVGYPLLVKAVAGGGGRGMRRVDAPEALADALAGARREALSSFGDGTLMLERLIERGRHIEIQVFADMHDNVLHLGERDCTAQRRRQKVIEEAPSPVVDAAMRASMGADAVNAARAVGYVGAGTIEFIVDADNRHYFLEMNTRLQVEHPVTECITGLDLVEWQLRVAAGDALPLQQSHIDARIAHGGHAIEARLYAEDPCIGFVPQTGTVRHFRPADALRPGVRIDAGISEGGEVSPWYDAMVAKVIAHGRDRNDAIRRLIAALDDLPLLGIANNGRFLRDLADHAEFRAAQLHTTRLDEWLAEGDPILRPPLPDDNLWQLAAHLLARPAPGALPVTVKLACDEATRTIRVASPNYSGGGTADEGDAVEIIAEHDHHVRWRCGGVARRAIVVRHGRELHLAAGRDRFVFIEHSPFPAADAGLDARHARARVAGRVVHVNVAVGDTVAKDQPLLCVEAMKMEMWLAAGAAGRVVALRAAVGEQVAAGALLIELEITA